MSSNYLKVGGTWIKLHEVNRGGCFDEEVWNLVVVTSFFMLPRFWVISSGFNSIHISRIEWKIYPTHSLLIHSLNSLLNSVLNQSHFVSVNNFSTHFTQLNSSFVQQSTQFSIIHSTSNSSTHLPTRLVMKTSEIH